MGKKIDMVGTKFGRLTVIEEAKSDKNRACWLCQCDCGNQCIVKGKYLRNGDTKSCGCLNIERVKQMGKNNIKRNRIKILDDVAYVYFNNTDNYFTCDIEDLYYVKNATWFESEFGYARGVIDKKFIFFHNYILNMKPNSESICDHIDGNRLNNRRNNLRIVNRTQNAINRGLHKNNTSGITGVSWDKVANKWTSYISVNGEFLYLGNYNNKKDAIRCRLLAEDKYFGEYKREHKQCV